MSIKDNRFNGDPDHDRLIRKGNEQWEMAGLARQDGDREAEKKHTEAAREFDRQAAELRQ